MSMPLLSENRVANVFVGVPPKIAWQREMMHHIHDFHHHLCSTSYNFGKTPELDFWLHNHVVTIYGDGAIYVLNVQSGALTILAQPGEY